jgi:hypothetical protein
MRVTHDHLQGAVTQQLGHGAQVDAGHHQPARKRVAQVGPMKILEPGPSGAPAICSLHRSQLRTVGDRVQC